MYSTTIINVTNFNDHNNMHCTGTKMSSDYCALNIIYKSFIVLKINNSSLVNYKISVDSYNVNKRSTVILLILKWHIFTDWRYCVHTI